MSKHNSNNHNDDFLDDFDLDDFDIVGPDDDADWDEVEYTPIQPSLSLDQLLYQLISDAVMPPAQELYALSDLSRQNAELVRQEWASIPLERRRQIVSQLVDWAKEDLPLHLGRFLRIAIEDDDASIRQTAVEGLDEEVEVDLVGPLVQMLCNDPVVEVRATVASALGAYVLAGELDELDAAISMRVEEALLAVLSDDAVPLDVRRRALESIAYSGEMGVRQLIEEAYYSPYEDMRVSALSAMGRSADVHWRGLARAELQNPSVAMRAEAAYACGELEAKAALNDLIELLEDEAEEVRLASIFALGRLGGGVAREALRVVSASDDLVAAEAAELALEDMLFYADSEGIPLYDEAFDEEDDEWDESVWNTRSDFDDRDLGTYE